MSKRYSQEFKDRAVRLPLSGLAGSLQVLLAGILLLGVAVGVTLFERKK